MSELPAPTARRLETEARAAQLALLAQRVHELAGTPREVGSEHAAAQNNLANLAVDMADVIRRAQGPPAPPAGPGSPFFVQQRTEHDAWLAVVSELRRLNVGDMERGRPHERLHDLIVAWGEELAQLRLLDPDPKHAIAALAERRAKIDQWNEADA